MMMLYGLHTNLIKLEQRLLQWSELAGHKLKQTEALGGKLAEHL